MLLWRVSNAAHDQPNSSHRDSLLEVKVSWCELFGGKTVVRRRRNLSDAVARPFSDWQASAGDGEDCELCWIQDINIEPGNSNYY